MQVGRPILPDGLPLNPKVASSYFFVDLGVCASVLPAADLELLLVRPSRRVLEAALAAVFDVWRFGVPVCESALPLAVFDLELVERFVREFDAAREADLPVVLRFAISCLRKDRSIVKKTKKGRPEGRPFFANEKLLVRVLVQRDQPHPP